MAKDYVIEQLKKEFKGRESFSREVLLEFYKQFEPELKETTFRWRIYQLKANRIITTISKDLFTLSYKPTYKPEIGDFERRIYAKVEKQFPDLRQCIWSTKQVNEFLLHMAGRFITILQVEKNALEPVYEFLKEQSIGTVYIEPEGKEIERYIFETESAIILQSLISKAPTQKIGKVSTITIEKLIVDLFCDKKLFIAFQGSELSYIVNNVFSRYVIDFTKLLNYSKRRGKEIEIMEFLTGKTNIPKTIFND